MQTYPALHWPQGGNALIRNPEMSPNPRSRAGKSLLSEYRQEMLRKKDSVADMQAKEEIQELVELADDLNLLFEQE